MVRIGMDRHEDGSITYSTVCPYCGKEFTFTTGLETLGFKVLCSCGDGPFLSVSFELEGEDGIVRELYADIEE